MKLKRSKERGEQNVWIKRNYPLKNVTVHCILYVHGGGINRLKFAGEACTVTNTERDHLHRKEKCNRWYEEKRSKKHLRHMPTG